MAAYENNYEKVKAAFCGVVPFANRVLSVMEKHNCYIAGGFVLSVLNDRPIYGDIDIYCPYESMPDMFRLFEKHMNLCTLNEASAYDISFFRRNGILLRAQYVSHINEIGFPDRDSVEMFMVDLMFSTEDRHVIDIISNFDLTCCEVWLDARNETVGGTHMKDTLAMKAKLRSGYNETFLSGNGYTIRRLNKYIGKGYSITTDMFDEPLTLESVDDYRKWYDFNAGETLPKQNKGIPDINSFVHSIALECFEYKDIIKMIINDINIMSRDLSVFKGALEKANNHGEIRAAYWDDHCIFNSYNLVCDGWGDPDKLDVIRDICVGLVYLGLKDTTDEKYPLDVGINIKG